MSRVIAVLIVLMMSGSIAAGDESLTQRLFPADYIPLNLAAQSSGGSPTSNQSAEKSASELNPGKALLLSAILPGAGQYSIGYDLRAALYLTIEIAAWTGVIYYYNKGQDKDKEFKRYADGHFLDSLYWNVEFDLARSPQWGDRGDSSAYIGTFEEWQEESWNTKIHYLPSQGFTHEMPTREERSANRSHAQQYYEMIGKYIRQFGFGWDDRFGDDPGTPWFDGSSPNSVYYMDMRYDSNQYLDWSSLAIQIAMLNHVASALDASFTARMLKRRAKAEVGFRAVDYDGHRVGVGGLNFTW
ncbi:MAG: hypothetical protein V2A61_06885 [Calditrichota bacterium]